MPQRTRRKVSKVAKKLATPFKQSCMPLKLMSPKMPKGTKVLMTLPENPPRLCHRCEYRFQHRETGHGPRFECGGEGSVYSCYMCEPVLPVILERNEGEKREVDVPYLFSARCHGKRKANKYRDVELAILKYKDGSCLKYWKPMKAH